MAKTDLTAQRLRELLHYDPETGIFTWKVKPSKNRRAGDIAGSIDIWGYRLIRIQRVTHRAHILAWILETGRPPENFLDHVDGNPDNNRIGNLRPATAKQNSENRRPGISNTTGFRGVSFHKMTGKFRATVGHNGKKFHIGLFENAEDAAEAARAKRLALFSHNTPEDLNALPCPRPPVGLKPLEPEPFAVSDFFIFHRSLSCPCANNERPFSRGNRGLRPRGLVRHLRASAVITDAHIGRVSYCADDAHARYENKICRYLVVFRVTRLAARVDAPQRHLEQLWDNPKAVRHRQRACGRYHFLA